jgi:hypothetical protein
MILGSTMSEVLDNVLAKGVHLQAVISVYIGMLCSVAHAVLISPPTLTALS